MKVVQLGVNFYYTSKLEPPLNFLRGGNLTLRKGPFTFSIQKLAPVVIWLCTLNQLPSLIVAGSFARGTDSISGIGFNVRLGGSRFRHPNFVEMIDFIDSCFRRKNLLPNVVLIFRYEIGKMLSSNSDRTLDDQTIARCRCSFTSDSKLSASNLSRFPQSIV